MALKKDGQRTKMTATIKKTTKEAIERLAEEQNRKKGQMIDELVENYCKMNNKNNAGTN